MYIQKAEITNIKSIEKFEIEFPNPAGWHVLIGDNGSGKSTIVRSMALALVGKEQANGLLQNWNEWLTTNQNEGEIKLRLFRHKEIDEAIYFDEIDKSKDYKNLVGVIYQLIFHKAIQVNFGTVRENIYDGEEGRYLSVPPITLEKYNGWFSSAFGPYRRFEGGDSKWQEVFDKPSYTKLAAHLSIFNESVALTEPIKWLKELDYKTLEKNKESKNTLDNLKKLINSVEFLPHNTQLDNINSDGVFFKDGNGATIAVNQMSDGYRSILSLTFELIRQLVRVYGSQKVFKNIEKGEMFIDLPGVVLIDEIDAHLHPTWQTRIGQWFLQYFPQLQFIVTTHSPLVCRACEKGSIWKLASPGSDEESGEVTGTDRERLIYGDILDAIEVFGPDLTISEKSVKKQEELVKLSKKKMAGVSSRTEDKKLEKLRNTFTTDDSIDL